MITNAMRETIAKEMDQLKGTGMYKAEQILVSPQGSIIETNQGRMLNFCSNNYLGLSNHPEIIKAAGKAMEQWGYGLSSVRFICGTQEPHKELEKRMSAFLGTEDTILYAACFDANGGVFEPLLGLEDAVISDELNHASIIDGVRLCKAQRFRYAHSDMQDLESCLQQAGKSRYRLICTDGVFSMDGDIARLGEICDLAERYNALVLVDDSHATGYIGSSGRGTGEYWGVTDRIDLITTTFGKALGGASGGCVSGRKELIEMLRQRSRPYLFSNTLAPAIVGGTLKVLEMIETDNPFRTTLIDHTAYFKGLLKGHGFDIPEGETAIIPVMIYDEQTTVKTAHKLHDQGIYVIGFTYPVVSKGKARIRIQVSAAHTRDELDQAAHAFAKVGKEMGIIT